MKSRYLINLTLILLAITLYWFNNQSDSPSTNINISPISSHDIDHILIERADRDSIIIKRRNDEWHLMSPLQARANPTRVRLILSLLNTPSIKQLTITPDIELSQYDIAANSTALTLNESKFIFGGVETLSKNRYILADQTLHLVNDQIAPLLNANATSFVDNRLLSKKVKISKLDIPYYDLTNQAFDGNQRILIENKNGQWVSQPNIDADSLLKLIDNWQYSHALQVLPLSKATKLDKTNSLLLYITLVGENDRQQYELIYSKNTLFIIDGKQQLAYQFAPGLVHQLFPRNKP